MGDVFAVADLWYDNYLPTIIHGTKFYDKNYEEITIPETISPDDFGDMYEYDIEQMKVITPMPEYILDWLMSELAVMIPDEVGDYCFGYDDEEEYFDWFKVS